MRTRCGFAHCAGIVSCGKYGSGTIGPCVATNRHGETVWKGWVRSIVASVEAVTEGEAAGAPTVVDPSKTSPASKPPQASPLIIDKSRVLDLIADKR